MIESISGVTFYDVRYARLHSDANGAGMPIQLTKYRREKIDPVRLENFIDFISSDNYLHDVAYGDRILKTAESGKLCIPNVLHQASHSKIIYDYLKMCN